MTGYKPLLAGALLALAACGAGGPSNESADGRTPLDDADVGGSEIGSASPDGSAPANVAAPGGRLPSTSGDSAAPGQAVIPAALQGRWGLTPADCTSAPGEANGLLLVGGDELRFYESVAKPARNLKSSTDSFSADFDWTGEGQSWSKFQSLQLQNGKLVRTESSPIASFTYARCD